MRHVFATKYVSTPRSTDTSFQEAKGGLPNAGNARLRAKIKLLTARRRGEALDNVPDEADGSAWIEASSAIPIREFSTSFSSTPGAETTGDRIVHAPSNSSGESPRDTDSIDSSGTEGSDGSSEPYTFSGNTPQSSFQGDRPTTHTQNVSVIGIMDGLINEQPASRHQYEVAAEYYDTYVRLVNYSVVERAQDNREYRKRRLDEIYESAIAVTESRMREIGHPDIFLVMLRLWRSNPGHAPRDFDDSESLADDVVRRKLLNIEGTDSFVAHMFGHLFALLYLIKLPTRNDAPSPLSNTGVYDSSEYVLQRLETFDASYMILNPIRKKLVWLSLFAQKRGSHLTERFREIARKRRIPPEDMYKDIDDCVAKFRNVLEALPVPLGM